MAQPKSEKLTRLQLTPHVYHVYARTERFLQAEYAQRPQYQSQVHITNRRTDERAERRTDERVDRRTKRLKGWMGRQTNKDQSFLQSFDGS